ncbi:Potassium/sodium hyperpolarization-activated cyclic nucleotide-gated channel 3 [Durusdinium trenchii]|uniref:Potassium/sodium hyperpolarization-activated cyclic nucleotide-gated channel 3 n=1 Tax=Durusdinium trenchii TaxID=1381693 RepID=A0ABP0JI33_9DINO
MEDAREDVCDAPSSGQSHGKQVNAFFEILEQMQVLQGRLRDAYETDLAIAKPKSKMAIPAPRTPRNGSLEDAQVRPPQNPTLSVLNLPESASILADDFDNAAGPVVGERSIPVSAESQNSLSPRSTKMSNKLMKRAREATANMEEELDADSLESALQLREEWNLPEERLKELKRLQRRMSVGSIALKPTQPKRQYLLHTEMSEAPIFVTHPNSWKRSCWDCLAVIAILFEISVAPLLLYRMDDSARRVADSLQWITTIFWVFDIPATFFTATYVNDILCFRLGEIARAYLRSWFLFDVLMLVPDLIVVLLPDMADGPAGVFRMARARRVLRLFRFVQIVRLWKTLQAFMSSLETRLTFLRTQFGSVARPVFLMGLLMAVAVHMLGSLWFAVGDSPRGWVTEEGLHEQPLTRQYTRSLEWALSKLPPSSLRLTVDLNTPLERWLGISATCGMLISGSIFVSFVTNTMADVARERTRTTKMIESVRKYCAIHSISYSYTMQMKRYVQQEHRRNEMQGHMPFLQHLPEGMIRELFQEARSPILHRHAFFREIGKSDPSMELNLCSQAVFELYHLPGDIIFDTTTKTLGMYFIAAGFSVYFHWSDSDQVLQVKSNHRIAGGNLFGKWLGVQRDSDSAISQTMLEVGEYVAEPAVWVNTWRHQGKLQAVVQARSLLVSTEDLFKVLQGYANALATTVVYARCFVKELNRRAHLSGQVTDLPLAFMKGGSEEDLSFAMPRAPKIKQVVPS